MRWTRIVSPDERHSFADGEAVWAMLPMPAATAWSIYAPRFQRA